MNQDKMAQLLAYILLTCATLIVVALTVWFILWLFI